MPGRLRFSSQRLLLIFAAGWAAGVLLLDRLFFRPYHAVVVFSVAMWVLVVLMVSIILLNPIRRLVGRVRLVEDGELLPEDFTRDLHAEPLALARRLQSLFKSMISLSKTDALTGLANRRQFDQALQQAYLEARRYQRRLSVMMMDVDLFKAINDTAGHQAGDEMLKFVAEIIRNCCRQVDLPARFGGDEFAVLLPETSSAGAAVVAGRIGESVRGRAIVLNGSEVKVTVSVGIADLNSDRIEGPEDLLELADRALRAAKDLGRNRHVEAHELKEAIWGDGQESQRSGKIRQRLIGLDTQFKAFFLRAVEEIVLVMERRDPYMADHARKVRLYAVMIARRMGLSEQLIKRAELAALLHDIGMLTLPDSILLCPRRLTKQELEALQQHPLVGSRILEGMEFLDQVIPAVRTHHERFDGKGYPDGLAGQAIPLLARVVAVADTFDAMTSPRSFRAARSVADALEEIRRSSGSQFDPNMVAALLQEAEPLGEGLLAVARNCPAEKPETSAVAV